MQKYEFEKDINNGLYNTVIIFFTLVHRGKGSCLGIRPRRMPMSNAVVIKVSKSSGHTFSKQNVDEITLITGEGVEGDAHRGETVKHRSRVKRDPTQPNLRQVHLIHNELLKELQAKGHPVVPGSMGENITTANLEVLNLPTGTVLQIGETAIEVTGLRNPCPQLNDFHPGLMEDCLGRDADGNLIRKAGIMGIILQGGVIRAGDAIECGLSRAKLLHRDTKTQRRAPSNWWGLN